MSDAPLTRLRVWYAKNQALRYTGHLDMLRVWERTLRRARLPLAYSQGFHPQPRLQQACALPLGFSSLDEIVDVWFDSVIESLDAAKAIQEAAPSGMEILRVAQVDLQGPALQTMVRSAEYRVEILAAPEGFSLDERVRDLLAQNTLPRERRGKTYDLRPLIEELDVLHQAPAGSIGLLSMRLSARENATGRPEEVLCALGLDPNDSRVERTKLIFA